MAKKLTADEIRLRGLLLAKNKDLLQLHRELVMGGMVREEDFWDTRKDLLDTQEVLIQQKRPQTINLAGPDIKGSTDIAGDLKFVLTPALIQSIFEQNPMVKKAFEELVKADPPQMDEKAFWMSYFKSKFFKEGLAGTGASSKPSSPDNLLDKYYEEAQLLAEEEEMGAIDKLPISIDPDVDLIASAEDHFRAVDPLQPVRPQSERLEKSRATIKKFNKLSLGIIEASGHHRIVEDSLVDPMLMDHQVDEPLGIEVMDSKVKALPSTVPAKRNAGDVDHEMKTQKDLLRDFKALPKQTEFQPRLYSFDQYSQLMADYPLSKTFDSSTDKVSIVPNLTATTPEALHSLATNLNEILKQFWSAYPPGRDAERKDKVQRMAQVLRGLQERLDGWVAGSGSSEEKQYYQVSFENLIKAASHAINLTL